MRLPASSSDSRSEFTWRTWTICGLLLLASAVNYMDRQTLANASVRISRQFQLSQEQYGDLEAGFGWAFATGALVFGFAADRISVRWLYPFVLFCWSAVGFATGLSRSFNDLLLCRVLLGFFEAGHWPCGLRATRALLSSGNRSMGNSLLQSGTSIGAIATPLLMTWLMTDELGSWRTAFFVVGAGGMAWIFGWLAFTRESDFQAAAPDPTAATASWWQVLFTRRMLVVLVVVSLINTSWQILRAWLPKFLQEGRGYSENEMLFYNAVWYAMTDVGCLTSGAMVLYFIGKGLSVNWARWTTFAGCATLCLLTLAVPQLDRGWPLLVLLVTVGAGALGIFPIYYSFSQDLSGEHQGKVTGTAGVFAWAFSPLAQKLFGRMADQSGSFDMGLAVAGCLPMAAAVVLWLFWGLNDQSATEKPSC